MPPNGLVKVRPVRSYGGEDGQKAPGDAAYPVSRLRAAELRANGLVEYAGDADVALAADPGAEAAAARVRSAPDHLDKMAAAPANKTARRA